MLYLSPQIILGFKSLYSKRILALTSVAQLVGHHPTKREITGLVPTQSLGCGCGPRLGRSERGNQLVLLSLSPSLLSPLSKNK